MKKRMLFLCIGHFDLYKIFEDGFVKYGNCEVQTVIYKRYKYKNKGERIRNFFSKLFLRKNLKQRWEGAANIASVNENDVFDYVFVICPEMLYAPSLQKVISQGKKSIVYYWDGFRHFPQYIPTLKYFDELYSFDPEDVKKYNLKFITNFYFYESRNQSPELDMFFVGTYDSRYPMIKKIAQAFEAKNRKVVVKLFTNKPDAVKAANSSSIEFINSPIAMTEARKMMEKARVIVDIHKEIQNGLSFRVFEAMGMGKKLITTNPDIVNYDFYNPNNIFIWGKDTMEIPENFLTSAYQELPGHIYKKYSRENWVKTVLGT